MGRLKIVFPVCCGMDVHRDFVIACIASTNSRGVTEYQRKRFSTYTGDLRKLAVWLKENQCFDVCMESTGKYWFPVHNILEKDFRVVVTHPKFVKAIKGKKTDKKDAMWIADLFKHDLVRGTFIPPADSSAKESAPDQRVISLSQAIAPLTRKGYVIREVADISDFPLFDSAPSC